MIIKRNTSKMIKHPQKQIIIMKTIIEPTELSEPVEHESKPKFFRLAQKPIIIKKSIRNSIAIKLFAK